MIPRRNISRAMRTRIMERHDWKCMICGDTNGPFDLDHDIPLGVGGRDDEDNLRPLCRADCHKKKTKRDARIIAKVRRQMNMRLDVAPKRKKWSRPIANRGFDSRLTKKLDGSVVPKANRNA